MGRNEESRGNLAPLGKYYIPIVVPNSTESSLVVEPDSLWREQVEKSKIIGTANL
jgi:hypothetical protein